MIVKEDSVQEFSAPSRWLGILLAVCIGFGVGKASATDLERAASFAKAPSPDWVVDVKRGEIEADTLKQASGGIYFVLADRQTRADKDRLARYFRFASKALNPSGVESIANLRISFDPSYQTFTLHAIDVIRAGNTISKLANADVRVLQRETELESLIYDGSMTASVFLEDVRVGDIVDYAYTIEGRNPVFGNNDFGTSDLQFAVPVGRVHVRLSMPTTDKVTITPYLTELKPLTEVRDGIRHYTWEVDNVPALNVDDEAPRWYDPYPKLQWGDYPDWTSVAAWAEPLYRIPEHLGATLQTEVDRIARTESDPAARLLAALRLVQSEVRYLGMEIGPNSHAPNPPDLVFDRRFGDCKDKTLLTLSLLDRLGIEARAALVNTDVRRGVKAYQPSPTAFDHVLVHARIDQRSYWIDPTRALQKGGLADIYQPDFGYALLVDAGTRELVSMKSAEAANERRYVHAQIDGRDGFAKPVHYTVVTEVTGGRAEGLRQTLTSTSLADLSKQYLNYYASYYPDIVSTATIKVTDDVDHNHITTTEYYDIQNIASFTESERLHTVQIESPDIRDYMRDPETPIRTAPLALAYPLDVISETEVLLPSEWPVKAETIKVEDPAFNYERSIAPDKLRFVITDRIRYLLDEIPAHDTARYIGNLTKARNQVSFQLTWTDPAPTAVDAVGKKIVSTPAVRNGLDNFNWLVALLAAGATVFWTWLAVKLYRYDPEPSNGPIDTALRGLSGWLILPAISITLSPLKILFVLISGADVYALETWTQITTYGSESYHALWAPCLLFELVGNLGLLMFSCLIVVLFYQRRSSLPRLYIAMLIASMVFLGIDTALTKALPLDTADADSDVDLVRLMISSAIWIPYFLTSRRVRSTFAGRRRSFVSPPPLAVSAPEDPAIPADAANVSSVLSAGEDRA